MMINPGSYAPWVLLSVLVSALVLFIVVLVLNHFERVRNEVFCVPSGYINLLPPPPSPISPTLNSSFTLPL